MDITQFLDAFAFGPDIEVVETCLPKVVRRGLKKIRLSRIVLSLLAGGLGLRQCYPKNKRYVNPRKLGVRRVSRFSRRGGLSCALAPASRRLITVVSRTSRATCCGNGVAAATARRRVYSSTRRGISGRPGSTDFDVWTERKRIEKLRYMHRNPVKRGLVDSPRNVPAEQLSQLCLRGARRAAGE